MSDKRRAYLYLHFCVLLWGFTAILGKLISLQALPLVGWRVLLCSAALWFMIPRAGLRALPRAAWQQMILVGALVGVHWLCFYGAIKLSNASVAVATMGAISFFSALAEPLVLKKRLNRLELGLGILVLPGMALVAGNLDFTMRTGFFVGILGALLAAVFTALNKRILDSESPPPALVISFVELFSAFLTTALCLPLWLAFMPDTRLLPLGMDWLWLLLLAGLCTLLPYYLALVGMRKLTAFTANLITNLEPVYGVLFAVLIFREDKVMSNEFYLGVAIIIAAVFSHPFLKKQKFGGT
jgi:drug/metabolite transporter (DMT)-like permease